MDDKIKEPANEMRKVLRQYYNKSGYGLYEEVKRSAGFIKPERFADALAISLFPSNGITITGFEIKTNRMDLLNELRNPEKTDAIKQFCDYWILFVSDKKVMNGTKKIPDDWGVWELWQWNDNTTAASFRVIRKPKQLYPKPVDRYFLASLLKQSNTAIAKELTDEQ